jgi:hypothetical protein
LSSVRSYVAVLLGDPLAQRRVAHRRSVRDGPAWIVVERHLRGLAQALDVDDVERRRAPGKGDRGHDRRIGTPAVSGRRGAQAAKRTGD